MLDWLRLIFIKKAIAQATLPGGSNTTIPTGPNAVIPGGSSGFVSPTGLPTDLGDLVATIFSWVLWIAAVVLIYVVFIAAFDLITKKEVVTVRENAKKRLLNALIGFVLILLAQSIPGIIRDFLAG